MAVSEGTQTDDGYPAPPAVNRGRTFALIGVVCAVVAIFFLPPILGPVGAVLAFVGYKRGYKPGLWIAIFAVVATVAGMALGFWVFNAVKHTQPAR